MPTDRRPPTADRSASSRPTWLAILRSMGVWRLQGAIDPQASLVLFEMSSLEDWPTVMFAVTDATAADTAPERDVSLGNALFCLVWVFLGSSVLLNLFVGVLITTFSEVRRREEGTLLMSDEQKSWAETFTKLMTLRPVRHVPTPTAAWRAVCFRLLAPLERGRRAGGAAGMGGAGLGGGGVAAAEW